MGIIEGTCEIHHTFCDKFSVFLGQEDELLQFWHPNWKDKEVIVRLCGSVYMFVYGTVKNYCLVLYVNEIHKGMKKIIWFFSWWKTWNNPICDHAKRNAKNGKVDRGQSVRDRAELKILAQLSPKWQWVMILESAISFLKYMWIIGSVLFIF